MNSKLYIYIFSLNILCLTANRIGSQPNMGAFKGKNMQCHCPRYNVCLTVHCKQRPDIGGWGRFKGSIIRKITESMDDCLFHSASILAPS